MVMLRCLRPQLCGLHKLLSVDWQCGLQLTSRLISTDRLCLQGATASTVWGVNKGKGPKKVALLPSLDNLDADVAAKLSPLQEQIKIQGDKIRSMKAAGSSALEINAEVLLLKRIKKSLDDLSLKLCPLEHFDRARMLHLAEKQNFYHTAFEMYGGVAGLVDFGILGTATLDNLLAEWHRHFIVREGVEKISSPFMMPESVLKASGHVDKFADHKVKDTGTGESYRLDHLIKTHLEKKLSEKNISAEDKAATVTLLTRIDGMTVCEQSGLVAQLGITAPVTGNPLSAPYQCTLMLPLRIDDDLFYLRPETAQGVFLQLPHVTRHWEGRLPFAVAQVGPVFRNESGPKLLRMRQFTLAEIEHFCDPLDPSHPRFGEVSAVRVPLLSSSAQMEGRGVDWVGMGEAVQKGLVANETLGYYLVRIQEYLLAMGIKESKLRFRQHMPNEMAHYACDCWDAECLTSHGWIECVGCADRSAYDLECHSKATGVRLEVQRALATPREEEAIVAVVDKGVIAKTFKKEAKAVLEAVAGLSSEDVRNMDKTLEEEGVCGVPGTSWTLSRAMVPEVSHCKRSITTESITPGVVEPSFGMERILLAVLEQCYTQRELDHKRAFFALPVVLAPIKVAVIALSQRHREQTDPFVGEIVSALRSVELKFIVDTSSGSIGRRYARTDQRSIPFTVTVDFDTVNTAPATVTLRERDTMQQLRVPIASVAPTLHQLATGRLQWAAVAALWPKFTQQINKI